MLEEENADGPTASGLTGISWIDAGWKQQKETERQKKEEELKRKMESQRQRLREVRKKNSHLLGKRSALGEKLGQALHGKKSRRDIAADTELSDYVTAVVDEFLLEEFDSDDEATAVEKGGLDEESDEEMERDEDLIEERKLFYCSRTHTQLKQFVDELRKTAHAEWIRVSSLGSRQNLCVNPAVKKLETSERMTDKCLDMKKSDKKEKELSTCPFYRSQELQATLRDQILVSSTDALMTRTGLTRAPLWLIMLLHSLALSLS